MIYNLNWISKCHNVTFVTLNLVLVYIPPNGANVDPPLLTSGCSSCTGRRGTVWPTLCCCLVWMSRCVCWPGCAARRGCWWYKPELTRGMRCSGAAEQGTEKRGRLIKTGASTALSCVYSANSSISYSWFSLRGKRVQHKLLDKVRDTKMAKCLLHVSK